MEGGYALTIISLHFFANSAVSAVAELWSQPTRTMTSANVTNILEATVHAPLNMTMLL
jgi:hypothetical protein